MYFIVPYLEYNIPWGQLQWDSLLLPQKFLSLLITLQHTLQGDRFVTLHFLFHMENWYVWRDHQVTSTNTRGKKPLNFCCNISISWHFLFCIEYYFLHEIFYKVVRSCLLKCYWKLFISCSNQKEEFKSNRKCILMIYFEIIFSSVVFPRPFLPTKPYLLP